MMEEDEFARMTMREKWLHVLQLLERVGARMEAEGVDVAEVRALATAWSEIYHGADLALYEVKDLWKRTVAHLEEMTEVGHLQREAERIDALTVLPSRLVQAEAETAMIEQESGPREQQLAARLRETIAAAREVLARQEVPEEEMQTLHLLAAERCAELTRRDHWHKAVQGMISLLGAQAWREGLPPEERKKVEWFRAWWPENEERVLGSLPLADRVRFEAMKPEDFGKLQNWKPWEHPGEVEW